MADKRVAAQAKRGGVARAVNRDITDTARAAAAVPADVAAASEKVSLTSVGPGFVSANKGGYKAFAPGPAVRPHGTPFGAGPEYQYDFFNAGRPRK